MKKWTFLYESKKKNHILNFLPKRANSWEHEKKNKGQKFQISQDFHPPNVRMKAHKHRKVISIFPYLNPNFICHERKRNRWIISVNILQFIKIYGTTFQSRGCACNKLRKISTEQYKKYQKLGAHFYQFLGVQLGILIELRFRQVLLQVRLRFGQLVYILILCLYWLVKMYP